MPEIFIQHVRHHTEHVRQIAGGDFVFEIANDNRTEVLGHDSDCFAPISRNKTGVIVAIDHAAGKGHQDQLVKGLFRPIRFWECILVAGVGDLVTLGAFVFAAGCPRPFCLGLQTSTQACVVPRVVEILRRDVAKEEDVMRFGCERQAKALDPIAGEMALGQILIDQMQ